MMQYKKWRAHNILETTTNKNEIQALCSLRFCSNVRFLEWTDLPILGNDESSGIMSCWFTLSSSSSRSSVAWAWLSKRIRVTAHTKSKQTSATQSCENTRQTKPVGQGLQFRLCPLHPPRGLWSPRPPLSGPVVAQHLCLSYVTLCGQFCLAAGRHITKFKIFDKKLTSIPLGEHGPDIYIYIYIHM